MICKLLPKFSGYKQIAKCYHISLIGSQNSQFGANVIFKLRVKTVQISLFSQGRSSSSPGAVPVIGGSGKLRPVGKGE